jgi:hypothetical protein
VPFLRHSVICQCLTFFVPHLGVAAWHMKCTKHMEPHTDDVQCRINVRTDDSWAKEIRRLIVSQAVVKIVMNPCVLYKTGN